MQAPKLDNRNSTVIVEQALKLAKIYVTEQEWKGLVDKNEPGRGLIDIFARLMEILIERLNRIPDKNFLSFLDMVGVEQKPPKPAEVPITFLLSKTAQKGGEIPVGTQVATTQTEKAVAQVFETRKTFFATPAQLKKVINLLSEEDQYSELGLIDIPPKPEDLEDESKSITVLISNVSEIQQIDHILYLGSENLFGRKEATDITLSLALDGNQVSIFDFRDSLKWYTYNKEDKDFTNEITVSDDSSAPNNTLFADFQGAEESEVNGKKDFWIACEYTGNFNGIQELKIIGIAGNSTPVGLSTGLTIEAAFSNSLPIDPSTTFYPFGDQPKLGDSFYMGSKAFSPDLASVTLSFTIYPYLKSSLQSKFKNITKTTFVRTEVEWQYLDENGEWRYLTLFKHTLEAAPTNNLPDITHTITRDNSPTDTEDGTFFGIDPDNSDSAPLTLAIPADIGFKKVHKQENYWIRAIIRSSDPYGKEAYYEPTGDSTNPVVVIGPTLIPPIVTGIAVTNQSTQTPIPIESIQTKNNFEFVDHTKEMSKPAYSFQPFILITSHAVDTNNEFFAEEPAIYMGFDRPFGDVFISMFAHLKDIVSKEVFPLETGFPQLVWEYVSQVNGNISWKPLDVQDGTANLTSSGTVDFLGPNDSGKIRTFDLLAEAELYWYRARLKEGAYDHPPQVKGIYLNTVMADNQMTMGGDQVIGSGTGVVNQKLFLIKVPVLSGDVWVKEPERPNEEEFETLKKKLERDLNQDLKSEDIILPREVKNGEIETWVRWRNIPNFHFSAPRSRHYTLDRIRGELTFGDGEKGLLPPAGKDNIIIKNYRTGGGEQANKVSFPLAVKELKSSISYVDKVFNVINAVGGSDFWSLDQTMEFGPQSIKNRDRAVTTEDYEWMTLQEFSQLERARCLPTTAPSEDGSLSFKPGAVTMTVVPKGNERLPQPSKGLLKLVKNFLMKKALGNIYEDNDVYVIGPRYTPINIKVTVKSHLPEESSIVERRIRMELEEFFHPLTGGENKKGWEFGRDVYKSEVYAVIERTKGVDHVESVQFIDKPGKFSIEIDDNSLVAAGNIEIEMKT
jgi:hypothetical protein